MFDSKIERNVIICGQLFMLLIVVIGVVGVLVGGNNELRGVFTNGSTENCADFRAISFEDDRFVSIIHVALDGEAAAQEHIADRVQRAADGAYFMRVVQRGTFYITGGDTENITKVFSHGGTISREFSHAGNEITFAQTRLTRARQI